MPLCLVGGDFTPANFYHLFLNEIQPTKTDHIISTINDKLSTMKPIFFQQENEWVSRSISVTREPVCLHEEEKSG